MKILHLSGAMYWGGNEQQLVDLIYNTKNFNVENIIFCFKNSPIEKYAIRNDISHVSLKKSTSFSFQLIKKLASHVKLDGINIIHIHTSNFVTTYVLADLLYKMKIPIVFSKKGISDKSSFISPIKYNYKGITKVICVSNGVKEAFKKVLNKKHHHKLTVVYDGIMIKNTKASNQIDLRDKLNVSRDTFLIGSIANHSQSKDLGIFIKTAHHLIHNLKRTDVYFVQMGRKSKFTKEFIGMVTDYNLQNYISFMGFVENAKEFLPQFDVYLVTSKIEGLPLVVYESFLNKIPVVSTVAGGITEVINHNKDGFLADIGDFKSLANHLNTLLNDEELRKKFAANSYKKLIKEYNATKAAKHTYNLYCTIIDEKH